ncbi:hypothetical protein I4F81_007714 [Pyropia yezoensis]|uniref:Uncharacterized protein n=1 Tax=Pyropia yezoensis TaxID=2788 RepID=A0ACC3C5F3_PYRYE|nr:hypothetical protein I4F81_007714 [Neopyropia yezoensis]
MGGRPPRLGDVDRGGGSGAADSGDGGADLLRGKRPGPGGTGAAGLRLRGAAVVAALHGAPPPVRGGGRGLCHPPAPVGGTCTLAAQARGAAGTFVHVSRRRRPPDKFSLPALCGSERMYVIRGTMRRQWSCKYAEVAAVQC